MHVHLAAQILSHSVAAGIYTHVALGAMPAEAAFTAELIDNTDSLFNCLNASTFRHQKHYMSDGSKHPAYLNDCKEMLSSMKVVGSKAAVP